MTTVTTARPASDFDPLMLMEAVDEVARLARPEDPARVAQRPWDAARTLSERFADAPPARRIAEHLGLSWPEVVRIALLAPGSRARALGHQFGDGDEDWLTPEYLVFALRLVATRLGVATLDPGRYRAECQRMLASDRARKHGGQLRLPTDDQVRLAAGSWARALSLAGLAPPARPGPRQRAGRRASTRCWTAATSTTASSRTSAVS